MQEITKKDFNRLRSEVRGVLKKDGIETQIEKGMTKMQNSFASAVSGNQWSAAGMPWASNSGRKAVLTEWFFQPVRGQPRRRRYKRTKNFLSDILD